MDEISIRCPITLYKILHLLWNTLYMQTAYMSVPAVQFSALSTQHFGSKLSTCQPNGIFHLACTGKVSQAFPTFFPVAAHFSRSLHPPNTKMAAFHHFFSSWRNEYTKFSNTKSFLVCFEQD